MNTVRVRCMVNDLDPAVALYIKYLGFQVKQQAKPNFAMLSSTYSVITQSSAARRPAARPEGAVTFGDAVGEFAAASETWAIWNDPNTPNSRAAPWAILLLTTVPLGAAVAQADSLSTGQKSPARVTPSLAKRNNLH